MQVRLICFRPGNFGFRRMGGMGKSGARSLADRVSLAARFCRQWEHDVDQRGTGVARRRRIALGSLGSSSSPRSRLSPDPRLCCKGSPPKAAGSAYHSKSCNRTDTVTVTDVLALAVKTGLRGRVIIRPFSLTICHWPRQRGRQRRMVADLEEGG